MVVLLPKASTFWIFLRNQTISNKSVNLLINGDSSELVFLMVQYFVVCNMKVKCSQFLKLFQGSHSLFRLIDSSGNIKGDTSMNKLLLYGIVKKNLTTRLTKQRIPKRYKNA